VLWADHDPYIPGRFADSCGAGAVEHVIGSGHWLPAEVPDQMVRRLLRFYSSEMDANVRFLASR
jgi:pimeloyl-ACP methyl ester carboxylesterase